MTLMSKYPSVLQSRKSLASFLVVALLSALAVVIPAFTHRAEAACNVTPEGQVLVMSNNVYETDKKDARNIRDMKNFVARMKKKAPGGYAPDIALIQEGRKKSMATIATQMTRRFGCQFRVSPRATASKGAWTWVHKYWKLAGQDTAVIYNSSSMNLRSGGHIVHDYDRSHAAPRDSVKVKKSAWSKLTEKDRVNEAGSPLTVVAASVHFPRGSDFESEAKNQMLKREFSEQLAQELEREQPGGTLLDDVIHVIAGDFNMSRYKGSITNPMPPYRVLTSRPYDYTDGPIDLARSGNPNPIDFLFATGKHLKAGFDGSNTHNESSKNFYSNHDLRWSLITAFR